MAEAVQVRVKYASTYLGPNQRALPPARAGEIITIAGGAYASDLLAQGLVEATSSETPAAGEVLSPAPVADQTTAAPSTRGRRSNR